MPVTLPNATTANTESFASIAAATATAEAAFIASTTVLINQATALGIFQIQPYLPALVTSAYVTTYFTGLGYSVLYPILPPSPFNWCGIPAGFPEVVPKNWVNWGCGCGYTGLPRIQLSWPPFPVIPPGP